MAGEAREELAGEALGREVDHADRAARAADAYELVGHGLVIGGEDRADGGGHDVERAAGERERLRVGLHPLELDAAVARLAAPGREVLGNEVEATTYAPASAARMAVFPVPAATSSTRCPGPMPQASTSTGPSPHTVWTAKR